LRSSLAEQSHGDATWPDGRSDDEHSRYIEAMVHGIVISCLYLPNGNPWLGPRFDYKLRWFEWLSTRAAALLRQDKPVVLAGDYNIIPTDREFRREALKTRAVSHGFRSQIKNHSLHQQVAGVARRVGIYRS
jgi:exonuclease III